MTRLCNVFSAFYGRGRRHVEQLLATRRIVLHVPVPSSGSGGATMKRRRRRPEGGQCRSAKTAYDIIILLLLWIIIVEDIISIIINIYIYIKIIITTI